MTTKDSNPLIITRTFDAPNALVFKAWTDPERMKEWWGPKGFTTPFCEIDLKLGGVIHYCMRSPEGKDYWGKGVYREIIEPTKIVYTDSFADEKGNIVSAEYYGMSADWPEEGKVTVTFEDQNGKTKLTVEHANIIASGPERDMCKDGWNKTLDSLAEYLENQR